MSEETLAWKVDALKPSNIIVYLKINDFNKMKVPYGMIVAVKVFLVQYDKQSNFLNNNVLEQK